MGQNDFLHFEIGPKQLPFQIPALRPFPDFHHHLPVVRSPQAETQQARRCKLDTSCLDSSHFSNLVKFVDGTATFQPSCIRRGRAVRIQSVIVVFRNFEFFDEISDVTLNFRVRGASVMRVDVQ
jgi:hypothetical protein